ncbi:LarC family nickel insertion protein [Roseospira visakhapatnamensis]|uniref:LarC family nickel insertion protein n=1 Tax=Roseospira visakhapatnamensis TaxID=390880 RepID=A0A7W6REC3_9PROT|nr:LarC family nickel insertion protein [Roseospira visakhapatnamensis]MBB4266474.1 hypothetical protein [Roseospira visakhapatnamensis]
MRPGTVHIHVDPVGGVAGDMLIAALLDAFPRHEAAVRGAVAACGLPEGWSLRIEPHDDGCLTGRRFQVRGPHDAHHHGHAHGHGHDHDHHHHHGHDHHHHHHHDAPAHDHATGRWRDLRARLAAAPLAPGVRDRALAIFGDLAAAEGRVHGKAPDDVTFHEVADWDSVADVVGAAALIEAIGPATWSTAPLPLGCGLVETAHGSLPVPAPATALLLAGLPVIDDGIGGERVTPTGAALLRHLKPALARPADPHAIAAVGMGFGTRRLPGRSNVLRVLVLEAVAASSAEGLGAGGLGTDRVAVLTFEVDDQTPEDLAAGLAHLRGAAGVLDVLQAPVFAKKGRMATQVQVLCRPERADAVAAACLEETTTLGVRHQSVSRSILPRRLCQTPAGPVKVATRPGGRRTAKLEADAQTAIPGAAPRARHRHAAVVDALALPEDPE